MSVCVCVCVCVCVYTKYRRYFASIRDHMQQHGFNLSFVHSFDFRKVKNGYNYFIC